MKHNFSNQDAKVFEGEPSPEGRRARPHQLAKHQITYGSPMECSPDSLSYTSSKNRAPARRVDHRGFQIWNGDLLGSSPEEVLGYILSTSIVPPAPTSAAVNDPLLLGIRDAADECRHERLPGDASAVCGCWPQEGEPMRRQNPVVSRKTNR